MKLRWWAEGRLVGIHTSVPWIGSCRASINAHEHAARRRGQGPLAAEHCEGTLDLAEHRVSIDMRCPRAGAAHQNVEKMRVKGSSSAREKHECRRDSSHDTFAALLRARVVLSRHHSSRGERPRAVTRHRRHQRGRSPLIGDPRISPRQFIARPRWTLHSLGIGPKVLAGIGDLMLDQIRVSSAGEGRHRGHHKKGQSALSAPLRQPQFDIRASRKCTNREG